MLMLLFQGFYLSMQIAVNYFSKRHNWRFINSFIRYEAYYLFPILLAGINWLYWRFILVEHKPPIGGNGGKCGLIITGLLMALVVFFPLISFVVQLLCYLMRRFVKPIEVHG